MHKGTDDIDNNWNFEDMVTAKEIATTEVCGKLLEVQCVRDKSGDAVPTTIVDVVELNRECTETERKNATLSDQNTDMVANVVEICDAGRTMCGRLAAAEDHMRRRTRFWSEHNCHAGSWQMCRPGRTPIFELKWLPSKSRLM